MEIVTKYKTLDGNLHDSEKAAAHHLDVLYTDKVSRLAAKLVDKSYQSTKKILDSNLQLFTELIAIKNDMKIVQEEY